MDYPPLDRAEYVRDARQRLGISVYQLARMLRLADPSNGGGVTVRRWESGEREPAGPAIIAIEALLTGWRPAHWQPAIRRDNTADR